LFGLRTASTRPFINAPYRATNSHLNLIYRKRYLSGNIRKIYVLAKLRTIVARLSPNPHF
ncbi:MAG: hypothetical protein IJA15_01570, partial [Clostridia bacterium]|nr:hypothetical protein [Clostridia bacterium]